MCGDTIHREDIGANLKKLSMARVRTNGIRSDPSKSTKPQSIWITAQITKIFICSHWPNEWLNKWISETKGQVFLAEIFQLMHVEGWRK